MVLVVVVGCSAAGAIWHGGKLLDLGWIVVGWVAFVWISVGVERVLVGIVLNEELVVLEVELVALAVEMDVDEVEGLIGFIFMGIGGGVL